VSQQLTTAVKPELKDYVKQQVRREVEIHGGYPRGRSHGIKLYGKLLNKSITEAINYVDGLYKTKHAERRLNDPSSENAPSLNDALMAVTALDKAMTRYKNLSNKTHLAIIKNFFNNLSDSPTNPPC
jgi:hypothetical protein